MATRKTTSQKTNSPAGAALTLLGLGGLAVSLDQITSPLSGFLRIPSRAALEALPWAVHAVWQSLQPCAHNHLSFLEGLLRISGCCWQFVLTLAGVA
jgi:hypothetical protein